MHIIDSLTALEPRARSCVYLGSIRGGACSRVGPARQFVDIAKQRRGVTSARHHRSLSTLRSSVDSVVSVTPSARTSGAGHEKSRLVRKAVREVSTRRLLARNLGVACALTDILLVVGCRDDMSTESRGRSKIKRLSAVPPLSTTRGPRNGCAVNWFKSRTGIQTFSRESSENPVSVATH